MISNATPLICLAKINKLSLLKQLFTTITIPSVVKAEVLIQGKPGYFILEEAIKQGWISIAEPQKTFSIGLGKGETAAIFLAKERKEALLIDDAFAIKAAEAFEISTIRTTTLVFLAVQQKIIAKEEAIVILNKLIEEGYYIAPQYYAAILGQLKRN